MDADVEPENVTASAGTASSWETVDLQRNVRLRHATSLRQPSTTVVLPSASEDSLRTEATGDPDGELSSRGFLGRGPAQENRDPVALRKVNSNTYNSRSECGIIVCGNANITIHHHAERDKLESRATQRRSEEDVGIQSRQQFGVPSRTQPSPHHSAHTESYESLAETSLPSGRNWDTRQDALRFTRRRLNIREHSAPTHVEEADEQTRLKQPEHCCPPRPSSHGDTIVFSDIHIDTQVAGFSGNVSFSAAAQHTPCPSGLDHEHTTAQCAKVSGRHRPDGLFRIGKKSRSGASSN